MKTLIGTILGAILFSTFLAFGITRLGLGYWPTKALFSHETVDEKGTCFIYIDKEFAVYSTMEGKDQKLILFRNGAPTVAHVYSCLCESRYSAVDFLLWEYYKDLKGEKEEQKNQYLLKCN